jgi:aerobic carbon-monoxide dehydrogenase large subunit
VPSRAHEVLDAAARAIGWHDPKPPGVGRGLALLEFSTSPGAYGGILRVARDGRVTLQTPVVEQGAGMLTVFRRIVAEELGLPLQQVHVEQSVDGIEYDRGVGGSRTTRMVGKLIGGLSRRIQARLADLVAAEFGLPARTMPGGFQTSDGRFVSFDQAASLADEPLVESMLFRASDRDGSSVFIAQAAEVDVDSETGAVTPRRIVAVQEAGRVIDPLLFKRQIEGGLLQGLGYALMEHIVVQDGRVQTANLHDYKVPTQADAPPVETMLVGLDPRLGITPVGEGASAGVAPAIANAVIDVLGPRALDLPLSPEVVRAGVVR